MTGELSQRYPFLRSTLARFDEIIHPSGPTLEERRRPRQSQIDGRDTKVSVVIPCFNYGHFLSASVGSAVKQAGCDTEVIVVDDASTDGSANIARSLAERFSNVTIIENESNLGHVATFNRGLEAATGEFIVRLDADDLLTPGSLARGLALFTAHPSVGLVYGRPSHFTSAQPPVPRSGRVTWTVWGGHDWIRERCRRAVNCITTPEAIIRTRVFRSVGPLSPRLKFAQDMEIWLRIAAVSDVGYIAGPDQALHRDHEASMSVTTGAGILTDLMERRLVFDILFEGPGATLTDAHVQAEIARRQLAREALTHMQQAFDRRRSDASDDRDLLAFALETYPDITTDPAWWGLERRRALTTERRFVQPLLTGRALGRRLSGELKWARWLDTGL